MVREIRVDDLQISFHGEKILDHLSFDVEAGEMLAIVGPNGAGKSTLLKAILGFITPQKGNISVGKNGRKTAIGYVPQSRTIDEETPIRARDFVSLGLPPRVRPWLSSKERETVKQAMKLTDTLRLAKKPIGKLSGGERQRVFFAQALVCRPDILLLDESTANLDPIAQEQMMKLVQTVCRLQGITVLFISHDLHLVKEYADRVLLLSHGHYELNSAENILSDSKIKRFYDAHGEAEGMDQARYDGGAAQVTQHLF